MPFLNNSQFAKLVGVNEGIVRRAIKKGRIIVRAEDGLIDADPNVERWNLTRDTKRVHDGKPRPVGRPKTATTAEAQAPSVDVLRETHELERQELSLRVELLSEKLKREKAENVSRDETRKALAAFSRLVRDKFVNFGNRYGPQLAAAVGADPTLLMAELDKAIRLQLDEVANSTATLPE